jgi:hypothetical protein
MSCAKKVSPTTAPGKRPPTTQPSHFQKQPIVSAPSLVGGCTHCGCPGHATHCSSTSPSLNITLIPITGLEDPDNSGSQNRRLDGDRNQSTGRTDNTVETPLPLDTSPGHPPKSNFPENHTSPYSQTQLHTSATLGGGCVLCGDPLIFHADFSLCVSCHNSSLGANQDDEAQYHNNSSIGSRNQPRHLLATQFQFPGPPTSNPGSPRSDCIICADLISHPNSPFCSACYVSSRTMGPKLIEIRTDHDAFRAVEKQFISSWKFHTYPNVKAVYKVLGSSEALAGYVNYRAAVELRGHFGVRGKSPGNQNTLWYGTKRRCNLGDQGSTQFCSDLECSLCSTLQSLNAAHSKEQNK